MGFTFQEQSTYAVGSRPYSVTIADMNGDGLLDLVAANSSSNTVSVELGTATGFATQVTYAVGVNPFAVTVADVNGDGRTDIISANRGSGNLSVLLGTATGFSSQTVYTTGNGPISVAAADVNSDGRLDLVTANYSGNNVSVLLGTATGFGAQISYAVGAGPRAIAAADVNGDGRIDLISANELSNTVSVLIKTATGFDSQTTYGVGSTPTSVIAADVNRDGRLDLVNSNLNSNTISVLLGAAIGFAAQTTYAVGSSPIAVSAGDVNSDGRLDVITANLNSNTVSVLLGTTTGFGMQATYTVGANPASVSTADVNGDGRLDVVAANSNSNTLSVLLNQNTFGITSVSATSPQPAGTPLKVNDTVVFTLATDQSPAVTSGVGGATPTLALSNGGTATYTGADAGGLRFSYTVLAGQDATGLQITKLALNGASVTHAAALGFAGQATTTVATRSFSSTSADVNGDGRLDLVAANYDGHSVSVRLGDGAGSFGAQSSYAVGFNPYWVLSADVNGDGRIDLISANSGSGTVSVLLGNGDGTFRAQVTYAVGAGPFSVTAADFNGDGRLDLATANYYQNSVSILLNNGAGTYVAGPTYQFPGSVHSVTSADVNGDGRADLVTANFALGTVSVLLNNGSNSFQSPVSYAVGTSPISVVSADVNEDGRLDLVTANRDSGNVSVLLGTGVGTFGARTNYAVGYLPHAVRVADVNGDGSLDLITTNRGDGTVSVLLGTGTGTFGAQTVYAVGSDPFSLTASDLNRDGRPDLITSSLTTNSISVLLNTSSPAATFDANTFASSPGRSTALVVDATAPTVTGLIPASSGPTNAVGLTYSLTFSEAVTGVDVGDFSLSTTGTAGAAIRSISGAGTNYTVILTELSGDGTLHLDLNASGTGIQDQAGNPIADGATGISVSLDHTAPLATSEADGDAPNAESATYTVHFSEVVSGVDADDFTVARTGTADGTISGVIGSGQDYVVTVSGITGTGSLALALASGAIITDTAGNAAALTNSTVHVVDRNRPPTADAGGPYEVAEGSDLVLDASASSDPDTDDTLQYAWDLDGDGEYDDATNAVVTLSAARMTELGLNDGPGVRTVELRVIDNFGEIDTATASITLINTAPVLTLYAVAAITEGQPATLSGSVSDAYMADVIGRSVVIDWGDGTTTSATIGANGVFESNHYYADDNTADRYTISVLATDKDGGSHSQTTDVTVTNTAPVVALGAVSAISEGQTATLSGSVRDASAADLVGRSVEIAWGDGSTGTALIGNDGAFQANHTYADDNAADRYTISVLATDKDGGSQLQTTDVTVTNMAPVLAPLTVSAISEGQTATLSGLVTDVQMADVIGRSVEIIWGDGSTGTALIGNDGAFQASHRYADDNAADRYTISVLATDKDGGSQSQSTDVTVTNTAPVLTLYAVAAITEGQPATLRGSISDAYMADVIGSLVAITWGDGTTTSAAIGANGAFQASHFYADDNAADRYTISVLATDKDGGSHSQSTDVTVTNTAPVVTLGAVSAISEGQTATLTGSVTDASAADLVGRSVEITWGDGSTGTAVIGDDGAFRASHRYADDNAADRYTISVLATDKDGGSQIQTTDVTVTNSAPVVTLGAVSAISEGQTATLSGSVRDAHMADVVGRTVAITWGDGSTGTAVIGNDGAFQASHTYADDNAADRYTISVLGTDKDGGSQSQSTDVTVTNVTPTAAIDSGAIVFEDAQTTIDVLANDSDVGGRNDPLSIVAISGSKSDLGASISIVNGKIQYVADADAFDLLENGQSTLDTFTYTVSDGDGGLTKADVSVLVKGEASITTTLGNGSDTFTDTGEKDSFVYGQNGDDVLNGMGGADMLNGGNGNDVLDGGAGIDLLVGGQGSDRLTGGAGADIFVFAKSGGSDTVIDFNTAQDRIQLLEGITLKGVTVMDVDHVGALDTVLQFSNGSASILGTGSHDATVGAWQSYII